MIGAWKTEILQVCLHLGRKGSFPSEHRLDLHVRSHSGNPTRVTMTVTADCGADNLATANAFHGHGNHGVYRLATYDHAGQAVQDPGFVSSANHINVGLEVTNIDNTYDGVDLHVGNLEAGFPHVATLACHIMSFNMLSSVLMPISVAVSVLNNLSHNDANHIAHFLGNVNGLGTAYAQTAYTSGNAALPLQSSNTADGIHNAIKVDASLSLPNNATAIRIADDSNDNAMYDIGLGAQSSGITRAMSSTLSPFIPDSVSGPNGRPRWACTGCFKTFSPQADMERHAKKRSGVLQYQCSVTDCRYRGSHRQDKLEQHRRNCHQLGFGRRKGRRFHLFFFCGTQENK